MNVSLPAVPETHRDGETVHTVVDLETRAVHVTTGLTPLGARLANLLQVTAALDKAGIEYFAVRGLEDRASVVAVHEHDRERVMTALGRALEQPQGFVRALVPPGVGRNPVLPGNRRTTWPQLAQAKVLRCFAYRAEPTLSLVYGTDYGCDVEFWEQREAGLQAPRANRSHSAAPQPRTHRGGRQRLQPSGWCPGAGRPKREDDEGLRRAAARGHRLPHRPRLHLGRRHRPGLGGEEGLFARPELPRRVLERSPLPQPERAPLLDPLRAALRPMGQAHLHRDRRPATDVARRLR